MISRTLLTCMNTVRSVVEIQFGSGNLGGGSKKKYRVLNQLIDPLQREKVLFLKGVFYF